jgi:hypothetical protein
MKKVTLVAFWRRVVSSFIQNQIKVDGNIEYRIGKAHFSSRKLMYVQQSTLLSYITLA